MKEFFEKNKIVLAIVVGVLIVGGAVYFSGKEKSKEKNEKEVSGIEKCSNVPELADGAIKMATKVLDGDPFLIEGGHSVRILGIDADERGYPCYNEAKNRLGELILNKKVGQRSHFVKSIQN